MTSNAGSSCPRGPPADGAKMKVHRDPSFRVRQAVRDNNVPLLARLQDKVDLRNTDKNRLTSLSWAAIEGSLEVFEWLLLDYGHDDQELSRDSDNNTILHLLASVPSPPTISAHTHLLRSQPLFPPRPNTKPLSEQITISLRMSSLYYTLFNFLLDWSNSGGKTALHVAAQAGNTAFINLLCDWGADIDLTDLQGNTPLHYASAWGHVETIRVLLERGCQYSSRNFEGFTASDFSYSNHVMAALQGVARELYEERKARRQAMGGPSESRAASVMDGRLRSGSTSTNISGGSGSAVSSNRLNEAPRGSQQQQQHGQQQSHWQQAPQMQQPSQSSQSSRPPSRTSTPQSRTSTPQNRPQTSRSPSVPIPTNDGQFYADEPMPSLGSAVGVGMRRANSAQTGNAQQGAYRSGRI